MKRLVVRLALAAALALALPPASADIRILSIEGPGEASVFDPVQHVITVEVDCLSVLTAADPSMPGSTFRIRLTVEGGPYVSSPPPQDIDRARCLGATVALNATFVVGAYARADWPANRPVVANLTAALEPSAVESKAQLSWAVRPYASLQLGQNIYLRHGEATEFAAEGTWFSNSDCTVTFNILASHSTIVHYIDAEHPETEFHEGMANGVLRPPEPSALPYVPIGRSVDLAIEGWLFEAPPPGAANGYDVFRLEPTFECEGEEPKVPSPNVSPSEIRVLAHYSLGAGPEEDRASGSNPAGLLALGLLGLAVLRRHVVR